MAPASSKPHPEDPTLLGEVWRVLYAAVTFLVAVVLVITWLPTSLVFRIYRSITISMVKRKAGDVLMASGGDAVWLQDSAENRVIINVLLTFRGKAKDIEVYRKHVYDKMVDAKDPDDPSKLYFPKMQMRATRIFHRYVWIKEKSFDINDHIRVFDRAIPGTKEELQDLVGEIGSTPLPEKKSPWEMILVLPEDTESDKFYAVFRIHHSMGDGVSLVKAFVKCLTDNPPEDPKINKFGTQNVWLRIVKTIFEGPGLILRTVLKPSDQSILHGQGLSGHKLVAWSERIELDLIKKMKSSTGTTVNDVLMSSLAGALRAYMIKNSGVVPKDICSYVPVDMRQSKRLEMDNQFGLVFLDLPLDEEDPKELLIRTKKRMDIVKASPEPLINNLLILYTMARLPTWITQLALNWFACKNSMILSNVPGPTEELSVLGHQIEDLIFWPPQRSNVGLGVSILSYNGGVKVGIMSDKAVLSNPTILVDLFVKHVKELAAQLKVE